MLTAFNSGKRVVVVGKRIAYSPRWEFVSDFLLDNLKTVFDREWGASASRIMPNHTLFRWLRRLNEARREIGVGVAMPIKGHLSALNRLGYALYLIEHNDKPPKSLIKRLRHPTDFDPALYEAIVASAFALAGAKIDGAEDAKGNQPKPEFFAKFPDGKTYAVEAKRKRSWKAAFDLESEEFIAELTKWLRDKLYASSKKNLTNPIYWFELGIGNQMSEQQLERLRDLVVAAVNSAEEITVNGQPPTPAYVFITNNPDLSNDDATNLSFFGLLTGFVMDDFREELLDLETAMDRHDKHRSVRWVHDCLALVQQVPTSFEGIPDELLDERGQPIETLRIGKLIAYPRKDGSQGVGKIEEVACLDREAVVVVADEATKQRVIAKVPLTEQEAKAAKKLGNAIFGKPEAPHSVITDPLRFYDRMLEIYADFPHESLLIQIEDHPRLEEFRELSRNELLIQVAREFTKRMEFLNTAGI
ncbi:hypothetical protein [Mesorhizobium delmotii]|uniref:Uncharacterized protein n=1 Tax=Mesorhizobium delmotii TaxID=1631247 RepID=A0A2P9ATY7_9HYPH|nr:hypothetical protein [Mesorhizobium delmotii]SJM34632.1 conserved hypothetical protein [Mesorhizobium delmotii]